MHIIHSSMKGRYSVPCLPSIYLLFSSQRSSSSYSSLFFLPILVDIGSSISSLLLLSSQHMECLTILPFHYLYTTISSMVLVDTSYPHLLYETCQSTSLNSCRCWFFATFSSSWTYLTRILSTNHRFYISWHIFHTYQQLCWYNILVSCDTQ